MSTKENIDYIKQELSNEEKLLESVIKAEKFYKKNKKWILILAMLVVLFGVGTFLYDMKKERDLLQSNEAYSQLLQNPSNEEALKKLQSLNPRLYRLFLYQRAIKRKDIKTLKQIALSDDPVLKELAGYHVAVITKDRHKIEEYLGKGVILKDLARLEDAYELFKNGDISSGRSQLLLIDKNSEAKPFAILLKHYGVAK